MEVKRLKWSNVNFAIGILAVRKGKVWGKDKDPKSERAFRDEEITEGTLHALVE